MDLIGVLQSFLLKQYVYERQGVWPNGEPHGPDAFVAYEFAHGCISSDKPCGCSSGADYGACCLIRVQKRIKEIEPLLVKSIAENVRRPVEEIEQLWAKNICKHGRNSSIHGKPYLTNDLLMNNLSK